MGIVLFATIATPILYFLWWTIRVKSVDPNREPKKRARREKEAFWGAVVGGIALAMTAKALSSGPTQTDEEKEEMRERLGLNEYKKNLP